MENYNKSDLLNIETYKQLLKTLNNDIEDVKNSYNTPQEKAHLIFVLSQQRGDLIANAKKNYPRINWVEIAIQLKTDTKKIKTEVLFKFNLN